MKKFILPILLIFSQLALIGQTTTYTIEGSYNACGSTVTCGSASCTTVRHTYEGSTIKISNASISGSTLTVTVSKCDGSNFQNGGVVGFRQSTCDCVNMNLSMPDNTYSSGSRSFDIDATLPSTFTTGTKTFYIMIDPTGASSYYRTSGITVRATTSSSGGGGGSGGGGSGGSTNYTISTSAATGGSVSGDGTYSSGSQATVDATPDPDYTFGGWYENNNFVSSNNPYTFNITRDRSFEARFTRNSSGNTLTVNPSEISLASTSGEQRNVNVGGNVTWEVTGACNWLTITLFNDYFTVSANSTNTSVSARSCRLTVSGGNIPRYVDVTQAGTTITPTYTLSGSVSPVGAGSVSGDGMLEAGQSFTLTPTAYEGYRFVKWVDNDGLELFRNPLTQNMPARNKHFTAYFERNIALPICGTNCSNSLTLFSPNERNNNNISRKPAFIFAKIFDGALLDYCSSDKYELYLADENGAAIQTFTNASGDIITFNPYVNGSLKIEPTHLTEEFNNHNRYGFRFSPLNAFLKSNATYQYVIVAKSTNGNIISCNSGRFTVDVTKQYGGGFNYCGKGVDDGTGDIVDSPLGHFGNVICYYNGAQTWQNGQNNGACAYTHLTGIYYIRTGSQCSEYITRFYSQFWNIHLPILKARTYCENTPLKYGVNVVSEPQMGDLCVYGTAENVNGSSHVAIVYKNGNRIQQNSDASDTYVGTHAPGSSARFMRPKSIKLYNRISASNLSLVEKTASQSNITRLTNNTPTFEWISIPYAKYRLYINKLNTVSNCFDAVVATNESSTAGHKITTPLVSGIYMCRIVAKLTDNLGSIQSDLYFFEVTSSASSSSITLSDKAINNTVVGSVLSNTKIYLKQTDNWQHQNTTDNFGKAILNTQRPLLVGDSMRFQANGYYPLKLDIDENVLSNPDLITPMFVNKTDSAAIQYPIVKSLSGFVTMQPSIQLLVSAKNHTKFRVSRNLTLSDRGVDEFIEFMASDTIVALQMNNGENIINVTFINAIDTIVKNITIYYYPEQNSSSFVKTINIVSDRSVLGAKLYIDDAFCSIANDVNTTLRLPKYYNQLTISKIGYITQIISINNDTSLNLNLQPVIPNDASGNLTFESNETLFKIGLTLKGEIGTSYQLNKVNERYTTLSLLPKSVTYKVQKLQMTNSEYKLLTVLNQPDDISLDSVYLMNIKNGIYHKIFPNQFGDSIVYDSTIQKLGHFKLYAQMEELVFMKRLRPVRNTVTGLRVHQSETLTIALSDLFKDPDLLPNDMTYTTFANANFDFTIIGDSIRIRHKTCQTGNLTFRIHAEHDKLVVEDDFQIQVTPLTLTAVPTPVKCYNTATGKIFAQINSTQPLFYNYLWNNQIRIQNNDSIVKGNYLVTVTDANNCTITSSAFVTEPSDIVTAYNVVGTSCHVSNGNRLDGRATTTVTGGVGNYSYQWNQGQIVANPNNLRAGEHLLIVKDGNGCADSTRIIVPQPDSLKTAFISTIPESCDGRDGRTIISTIGGTPQYNYRWSNNETTYAPTGLARGANQVTVTDIRGCTQVAQVSIPFNDQLKIDTIRQTALPCFGDRTATATAITSGASNMTYVWSNGGRTAAISGLNAGAYTVTVTTPAGCSRTKSVTITQPTQLSIDSILKNASPCIPKSGTAHAIGRCCALSVRLEQWTGVAYCR
jgi:Divergent InlB B-repeat domain